MCSYNDLVNFGANPYVFAFSGAQYANLNPYGSWLNTVQSPPTHALAPVNYVQNMWPPLPSQVMLNPWPEQNCRGRSFSTYSSCPLNRYPFKWGD